MITRATAADLDDLVRLMVAYCEFYGTQPPAEALRQLAQTLHADPPNEGVQFIARDKNLLALGFATIYWTWSTTQACRIAVMNDLYVVPQARGNGLAQTLIARCAKEAADHGVGRLEWQTRPDNARAQSAYDRITAHRTDWLTYYCSYDIDSVVRVPQVAL